MGNIDNDWIKTLVSTLIGAVTGIVASEIIQRTGKVKVYCYETQFEYYSLIDDGFGGQCQAELKDGEFPKNVIIRITFDVLNKSRIKKNMREVKFEICNKNNKEIFDIENVDKISLKKSVFIVGEYYNCISIDANSVDTYKGKMYICGDIIKYLDKKAKGYLVYRDENGKQRKVKIVSFDNYKY